MSVTESPRTFSDLYTSLLNKMRFSTSDSSLLSQAKREVNTALLDMHLGAREKAPWAEREGKLILQPSYTTGTVTITTGSTTLTGTDTLWNTNNDFSVKNARAGGKIALGSEVYEVSSVGGDTSITLTSAYTGDDLSGSGYTYFEDEYDLASDFLRPLDIEYFDHARSIPLIGRRELRLHYPRRNTPSTGPFVASIFDRPPSGNTTPRRRLVLHPPPSSARTLQYWYVTKNLVTSSLGVAQEQFSADADEPLVPYHLRYGIVLKAAATWWRDKKDDARSGEVNAEYVDFMVRWMGDTEVGANRPALQPRVAPYHASAKRPYSRGRGRGRYSTGTAFDEMRD